MSKSSPRSEDGIKLLREMATQIYRNIAVIEGIIEKEVTVAPEVIHRGLARLRRYVDGFPRFTNKLRQQIDWVRILLLALVKHSLPLLLQFIDEHYLDTLFACASDKRFSREVRQSAAEIFADLVGLIIQPRINHQVLHLIINHIEEDLKTPPEEPVRWIELCVAVWIRYDAIPTKRDKIRLRRVTQQLSRNHPRYEAHLFLQDRLYIVRNLHLEKLPIPKNI